MSFALDHVFVCVEDAPEAERILADFGMQFGRRGVHPGQGTANACAFFDNAYLEILRRHDDDELRSAVVRPLGLWERMHWRTTGASPFGIALRPGDGSPALETWPYEAPFLPAGAHIPIVTPRCVFGEPVVFLSMVSQAPAALSPARRPPLDHLGRRRSLTRVAVSGPQPSRLSPGVSLLCEMNAIKLKPAAEHVLELEWDDAASGQVRDFRPTLPMVLRW